MKKILFFNNGHLSSVTAVLLERERYGAGP